jgi:hypothetical protein
MQALQKMSLVLLFNLPIGITAGSCRRAVSIGKVRDLVKELGRKKSVHYER